MLFSPVPIASTDQADLNRYAVQAVVIVLLVN